MQGKCWPRHLPGCFTYSIDTEICQGKDCCYHFRGEEIKIQRDEIYLLRKCLLGTRCVLGRAVGAFYGVATWSITSLSTWSSEEYGE